jgi:hypothetical protein
VCECFTKLTKEERNELYDVIANKGYDLFYFEDFDDTAPTQPITQNDMMKWQHFNLYAVPKGK